MRGREGQTERESERDRERERVRERESERQRNILKNKCFCIAVSSGNYGTISGLGLKIPSGSQIWVFFLRYFHKTRARITELRDKGYSASCGN